MMLERFTQAARDAVTGAQGQARTLNHQLITTPHLLLSLAGSEDGDLLRTHGVTPEAIRTALGTLTHQDPRAADDDAAALAALGIDLTRIRAAVEATFGPGALDRAGPEEPEEPETGLLARLGRLRRRGEPFDEVAALRRFRGHTRTHLPFSPSAKKALGLSLREALRLGSREIGTEHLILGLLRCSDGAAAVLLDRLGTDTAAVRRDAEQRLRRSA